MSKRTAATISTSKEKILDLESKLREELSEEELSENELFSGPLIPASKNIFVEVLELDPKAQGREESLEDGLSEIESNQPPPRRKEASEDGLSGLSRHFAPLPRWNRRRHGSR